MKRIALSLALVGALFIPSLVRAATSSSSSAASGCPCSGCPFCDHK